MKHLILLLLFVLSTSIFYAQEVDYPNAKLIGKRNFEKAEKAIIKDYTKNPSDVLSSYAAYKLYIDNQYPKRNVQTAYDYLAISSYNFDKQDESSKGKLLKKNLTKDVLLNDMKKVTDEALQIAIDANTLESYNHFLTYYKAYISQLQIQTASYARNAIEFANARKTNTIEAYQNFINTRPNAKERSEAEQLRNSLAYEVAERTNTIQAYEYFIKTYSSAKEVGIAQQKIYQLAYDDANKQNDETTYRKYAKKYPSSPYASDAIKKANKIQFASETTDGDWLSFKRYINNHPNNNELIAIAQSEIYNMAKKTQSIEILDYCITNFNGQIHDSAIHMLNDIYVNNFAPSTFTNKYSSYIPSDIREKDDLITNSIIDYDQYDYESVVNLIKNAAPYDIAYFALVEYISDDIEHKRWDQALSIVNQFESYFGDSPKYKDLVSTLSAPIEPEVKVNTFGREINTSDGNEYDAVISTDDKTLYFCAKDRKDNLGGEDIYYSKRNNKGQWSKATLISDLNYEYGNEAPVSISPDGTIMILFKSGDLYASEKTAKGWANPEILSSNINISEWQADAMITSDGQAMLFAANQQVENELEASTNIFVSILDENGNWGKPISLGPTINTCGTDRSPFLHPDMKTLYFCSDNHSTLGGLDVFKTTRLSETSWTEWSEPINMGKQINTIDNDCWYRISTDGKTAYFSQTKDYNQDLCWMNIPKHMRPNMVATISGTLTDNNNNPVATEIRWEDLQTGEAMGHSKTDPADGTFFIVLPLGKIYGYYVDDDSYFPISQSIDLREEETAISVEENISIVSFEQMVKDGLAVPINNLFFNVAKHSLLPYSLPELRRVAKIIKKQGLNVEIAGHTDNTGTDDANQILSEQRAQAVKDFLVGEGCDPSKLTIVGYGSSKPVASNDNEKGRKLNRRVELRFVNNE